MTSLPRPLDASQASALRNLIDATPDNIVITCHVSPDGDAIGSSLALRQVLLNMGKRNISVVTPDMPPRSLSFMPDFRDIVVATRDEAFHRRLLRDARLIFCLDFNMLMRVDKMQPALESSHAVKVMIDHHLHPEGFASITVSHPEMSSTCYLLYLVLRQLGLDNFIDNTAGGHICVGMMTDTGNFTYNASAPGVYLVLAHLVELGVDKERLYKLLFDTNSEASLRLCAYALYSKMQILEEYRTAVITLTDEELAEFGYQKGDTEGLVNRPLSMPGIVCSVFLRQDEPGFVKISARSKGHFPVNRLCAELFGGGGHENAAGGEHYGSLSGAVDKLINALPSFHTFLP